MRSFVDATPRLLHRLGLENVGTMVDGGAMRVMPIVPTRSQLRKAKSQHMINNALRLHQNNVPSTTMLNDPYFRDKPEMSTYCYIVRPQMENQTEQRTCSEAGEVTMLCTGIYKHRVAAQ